MMTGSRHLLKLLLALVCLLALLPAALPANEVELSDIPLATLPSSGPANIMFVLDDSGSMDFEFMTPENHGAWNGDESNVYLFQDPGDNTYARNNLIGMGAAMRWKSQWSGFNKMYYNPEVTYTPWPRVVEIANNNTGFDNRSQSEASTTATRSHPMHDDWTLDLRQTFYTFGGNQVLVDDGDSGFTRIPSDSTKWLEQTDGNQASGIAIDSDYDEGEVFDGATGARWTPDLSSSGDYEVYVNWPGEHDNDVEVNYVVHHSGTNSTIGSYFHNSTSNGWLKLGTFDFNSGTDGYVQLEVVRDAGNGDEEFAADAVKFVPDGAASVDIPRAHYYVWSDTDNCPYLVTMDSSSSQIQYYKAGGTSVDKLLDNNDDEITTLDPITDLSKVPADVQTGRSYTEELQNFANWYSFYRRRELTANAAIASVITDISDVQVGFQSIQNRVEQGVLPVRYGGSDQTNTLLELIYGNYSSGGTPLRYALQNVGEYYDDEDSESNENLGDNPYVNATAGGECQQSFAIVMTDGYWNGGSPGVGNADDETNLPYAFQDSDSDSLYSDDNSDTLADVAMYYYQNDLSSSLADKVPTSPESVLTGHDPADWQHMVTFGVSFGLTGSLDPASYTLDVNATSPDYPSWPDPTDTEDQERVDDLWHASVNGRGQFLSASNPMELVNSLKAIIENIESRVSSASSVSINGDELFEQINNDIRLFQSSYSSASWTGDVKSFGIIPSTGEVNATAEWSAQNMLNTQTTWSSRIIASFDGSSGIPFAYNQLTSTQKSHLGNSTALVDYLKGDPSNEGTTYRSRSSILGDIVHSSPAYHEGVIYAGANDGMLHAFNATNGQELFAYIPNLVFDKLADFADPSASHSYYVDLTPVIEKGQHIIDMDSDYESLLVGGLRKGGKGYYALDVTDAATTITTDTELANSVLWEYSNATHLGYTYSMPSIIKSNDPNHEWVILFGNGYNSGNGHAELFVLDPDGTLVKRIDTGYGYANGTIKNGLSTPTPIDVDNNETVDYVYAGDLKGNMWKFDLTASDKTNWEVAFQSSNGTAMPLFQARNDSGQRQPITSKPDVMRHCDRHGYMVLFGTGKHLGPSDNSDLSVQTVYGIWDYGDDSDDQEYLGAFQRSATNVLSNQPATVSLLEQVRIGQVTANGTVIRLTSDDDPTWATENDGDSGELGNPSSLTANNAGWYFDLPDSGERVVSPMMIRDGKAIFISHVPSSAPCSCGGYSIVHELDACDGGRLSKPAFDLNNDGVIDEHDKVQFGGVSYVPSGIRFQGKLQPPAITQLGGGSNIEIKYFSSSSGTIETIKEKAARIGITFWKEMVD